MYHGNVVVNPGGSDRPPVPYLTGGVGAITLSPHRQASLLGIENYNTFLTENLGGGVKWFVAPHLGFRGDYRLFIVKNNDAAPLFFGSETHRTSRPGWSRPHVFEEYAAALQRCRVLLADRRRQAPATAHTTTSMLVTVAVTPAQPQATLLRN